jgi:hypothetical protein
MGLLDWMKDRKKENKTPNLKDGWKRHSPSYEREFAEYKQDTEMRREWERTGKHSEAPPLEVKPIYYKPEKRAKRVKLKDHEIPF